MNNGSTRRDFLKSSGTGIATLAASSILPASIANAQPAAGSTGDISVWTTGGEDRLKRQSAVKWKAANGAGGANSVVVDPAKSYQEILGFGAAFTDAACYTFNRLDSSARDT